MANTTSAPQIYGGDEVAAIVLDPGSFNTRIGYAGEDCPRYIVPSYYSTDISPIDQDGDSNMTPRKTFGESINLPRPNQEISSIVQDGIVVDWDSAQEQYEKVFTDLKVNFAEQPILYTETVWNENENKVKALELSLEYFKFPGFYLAKQPTLVSFASARSNCLIVDIGHDVCSVTPVIDGICLIKNTMKTHYAGKYLNQQILSKLDSLSPRIDLTPKYNIKSKTPTIHGSDPIFETKYKDLNVTKSYETYQRQKTLHEIKETIIQVPEQRLVSSKKKTPEEEAKYSTEDYDRYFEFPTGQSVEFRKTRFEIADSLFDPESYQISSDFWSIGPENGEPELKGYDYKPLKRSRKITDDAEATPDPATPQPVGNDDTPPIRGITQLVNHAISLLDVDIRSSIAHNIIVTGGTSLIPGLTERLNNELSTLNPGLKIRIHASGNTVERLNQSWIGGSILASLGTFHQLWVSKQEYEEVGADRLLNQRFR